MHLQTLQKHCDDFASRSGIKLAVVLDQSGQLVASSGTQSDLTAICALVGGIVAASKGLSAQMHQNEFGPLFLESAQIRLILVPIGQGVLVLGFDQSLHFGQVRFWVDKKRQELEVALTKVFSSFAGITDAELDRLMI